MDKFLSDEERQLGYVGMSDEKDKIEKENDSEIKELTDKFRQIMDEG